MLVNDLVQKLKEPDHRQSSSHLTAPVATADLGIDTPGKFLDPSKDFHPSFDLQVSSDHTYLTKV